MRWRILLLLVAARISLGLQFQVVGSTSEYIISDFRLSYAEVGTLIGLFMLPGLFLALPFGFAGRWYSDRVLTSIGLGLIALGGLTAALASSEAQIGAGRLICGVGFVLTTIYLTKMVTDWFSGREIATALGALVMTWPLGIAIGQISHEWMASNFGWSSAFWLASAYAALSTILVALLYRDPAREAGAGSIHANSKISNPEIILVVTAALVWAFFNAGFIVYLSFSAKLLTVGGLAALTAAAIVSIASYIMMGTGVLAGALADRTRKPDLILYVCTAAAIVSLVSLKNNSYALVLSVMFGIGMASAGIIMSLSGQAMLPSNRALGMGLFFSIYFLVVAPAATIAGWLFDLTGNAYAPILFAATLFTLTALSNALFRYLQRSNPLCG